MYACICHAVTDHQVVDAVHAGAASVDEIGAATLAGTSCGVCHDTLDDLIDARCAECPLAGQRVA